MPVAAGSPGPALAATALATHRHNPRVRAAICYALPFIPALSLLLREHRNGFIRMHASQAIAFFGLVAGLQVALFIALVATGGIVTDLHTAAVVGLVFYALFFLAGALGLLLWLALLRDALAGRFRRYPAITRLARRVERLARRVQRLPA